ncbi:glucose-6-phosphate isomerase [Gilvimarinus polysaccharolyticus]|uniref:glucose-6-phosphate isomerase n=1 Tax=Gilvimarinus polysaccharolyticus TaxID=863921 RepID=UPI0006733589|nr:glucose-6-phosphate isomerase [Gilvimarinus polysaccharolyticus]
MSSRTELTAWQTLETHARDMQSKHMSDLFDNDDLRFAKFSIQAPNILLDYSKNLITEDTRQALIELAKACDVESLRDKMFAGEKLNRTEDRAVLHVALRDRSGTSLEVDGDDVRAQVKHELERMRSLVAQVRGGDWRGYTGKPMTDIVSIGIGGSNLGPLMVTEALSAYSDGSLNVHYVSNIDGYQIAQVLRDLDPETTLFVIASKTFTTLETMTNAGSAEAWFLDKAKDKSFINRHFIAVSSNRPKAMEFGVAEENIFDMWDWVGGRFSLWSAIGLPIALNLGMEVFEQLLDGAFEMDQHFLTEPLAKNAPVMLALMGIWNNNFLGRKAHALLPYDQCLHRLAAYMQQAEMESNGKSVNWSGERIDYSSVPLIWGEVGINGQHAFYQCLHQGTQVVPADFIGSIEPTVAVKGHHDALMANFFAQSEAMMRGISAEQVREELTAKGMSPERIEEIVNHKVHEGNRPTNTILMQKVSARSLGSLIAMYEHKIFVQGIIWQVHSFDQWGVELGKVLANGILAELTPEAEISAEHDASTRNLIEYYKKAR